MNPQLGAYRALDRIVLAGQLTGKEHGAVTGSGTPAGQHLACANRKTG